MRCCISRLARCICWVASILRCSRPRISMAICGLARRLSILFGDWFICWPRRWFVARSHPRRLLSGFGWSIIRILWISLRQLVCVFLLSLVDRSFPFQLLLSLFPISHLSLQYCFSFPFLPCSLLICIHRVLPLLVFGLPLICWIGSSRRLRSWWLPSPKNAFAMRRGSIWHSRRRRIEAWLTIRSNWDSSVGDTRRRLVASLIDRWSLPICLGCTVSSRIWCPKISHPWWRTSRICSVVSWFVHSLFWCLRSSERGIIGAGRSHSW